MRPRFAPPEPLPRLTACMPDWSAERDPNRSPVVGVVPGEGIGPEAVGAALTVLQSVARTDGITLDVRRAPPLTGARRSRELSDELAEFCDSVFTAGGALLCGPIGGRFVYQLRARFDLYCKLIPLTPNPALADVAIVRTDLLEGVDILIVRENVGGLYLGDFGRREDGRTAYQTLVYRADQVARIIADAAALAKRRRGKLSVVVKSGGIPEASALWTEQARAIAERDVELQILEVDNASFQLVACPQAFDVVVAPNLLGDILADVATVLLGSRGMSFSGNFGPAGRAVYQTGHGAAYDLEGSDRANPIAQILSVAMMLRESFGRLEAASRLEAAVEATLAAGFRTPDVAASSSLIVGTREMAERIAAEVSRPAPARAEIS